MTRSRLVRTLLVGALLAAAGTTAVTVPLLASAAASVYEAESGTISQGVIARHHPGLTGTGFVDDNAVTGAFVEVTVTASKAGSATLALRYANGGTIDRPVAVTVNGAGAGSVPMSPTGGWSAWKSAPLTA